MTQKFKIPKIKLYNQILIGFVLGIVFGIIFRTDNRIIEIKSGTDNITIKDWLEISYVKKD